MKRIGILVNLVMVLACSTVIVEAQTVDRKMITWEQKKIDMGAILEENGPVTAEFFGRNENSDTLVITDVISDCGCTTVEYTKDTLSPYMVASVQVQFDPTNRGGFFSKLVIIRTNKDIYGDTLYLEGYNLPKPEEIEGNYPYKIGDIGFRLPSVNMGNVFTNEPKVKYVEVFNFGEENFNLQENQSHLPDYLGAELFPDVIPPAQRGLLVLTYDGEKRNDLGFFEEEVTLDLDTAKNPLAIKMVSVVYEYFPPIPKSMKDQVAKLGISESEINLSNLNANTKVSKSITLSNLGPQPLDIRKISTNCECLEVSLDKKSLLPDESTKLTFTFDPKGRKGIDHKHITLFSNDPLQPVRTIVIRSSVK